MEAIAAECAERNGATWIRDCLLDGAEMAKAIERLESDCRDGIRHFSALGRSVPLNQVGAMQSEISRLDDDLVS